MGKQTRIRLLVVFAFVVILLIFLFHHSGSPKLPPGARLKLPTGPVKPMISIGAEHGLVLAGDGTLWSWGTNYLGVPVLGLSNVTETPYLRRIGNDTNWAGISAAWFHNVAIKSDGTLWAWGANPSGELGAAARGAARTVSTPMPGPPGNDWKQAAAGGSHTIALKKDGTIWSWGNNASGQLGIGTTNNFSGPAQIGSGTNWVRVWAGYRSGAAQQADGSLWVWGVNPADSRQRTFSTNNLLVPVRLSPDTNWAEAALGADILLAIRNDGTLWASGLFADLYFSKKDGSNSAPRQVGTDADWRTVTSSFDSRYDFLTKKDGSVWAVDVTGNASPAQPIIITPVKLDKQFVAFGAGQDFGVALTRDGEVWTWGVAIGESTRGYPLLEHAASVARKLGYDNAHWGEPEQIIRAMPWLLPNMDPDAPPK